MDRSSKLNQESVSADGHAAGDDLPTGITGPSALARNGHPDTRLAGLAARTVRRSRLLDYLPAIFSADPFAARFLLIFEDVLDPIEEMIRTQPAYFDPATAPPALLDWLAQWVDLQDGEGWGTAERRALVLQAVSIYGSRGTLQALKLHLAALCGSEPLVAENTDGFRLGADARLGINTPLGRERPAWLTITIVAADPAALDEELVRAAITAELPLGTRYTLRMTPLHPKTRSEG